MTWRQELPGAIHGQGAARNRPEKKYRQGQDRPIPIEAKQRDISQTKQKESDRLFPGRGKHVKNEHCFHGMSAS
jgi:hypothetical protein